MAILKVKILKDGPYRLITTSPGTTQTMVESEMLKAGDERVYDSAYVKVLEDNELVEVLGDVTELKLETKHTEDLEENEGEDTKDAPNASQNAINMANENDVDLSLVEGTGKDGKITIKDVTDYIRAQEEVEFAELKEEVEKQLDEEAELSEGE